MLLKVLGLFAVICLVSVVLIAVLMPVWEADRPATCYPDNCFCELIRDNTPYKQPVNAFSSLAYVLAGTLAIVYPATRESRGPFFRTAGLTVVFALAAIAIGVGSAYYHASLTFSGQFLDVLGMYMLTTLMLVYAWRRLYALNDGTMWLIYSALMLALAVLLVAVPELRRWLFALVLVVALVFEGFYLRSGSPNVSVRWLLIGLGLFAVAFVIWAFDNAGTLCDPSSLVQGHAIWHLLGAAATVALFNYYAAEAE